jgi:hypothetical protein
MIRSLGFITTVVLFSSFSLVCESARSESRTEHRAKNQPKSQEVSLQASTETASEPLTTDKIAELDPAQPNPHLRRWVVARQIELPDWKTKKLPGDLVGVQAAAIVTTAKIYLRPPGPWYDTLAQFPCADKNYDPAFATESGSRSQAAAAAQLWSDLLSENRLKITHLLSGVAAVNERSARSKADRVMQEWITRMDHEWRERVTSEVLPREWKKERKLAEEAGYCKGAVRTSVAKKKSSAKNAKEPNVSEKPTSPEVWIEQEASLPSATSTPGVMPLARAPARRWQGFFAVRMDVGVSDNSVLGQMLIDPATTRSILSPDWLRSQGMPPEWLLVPEAQLERVKIEAGAEARERGLGKAALVEKAIISDYRLSMHRFLLFHTELFDEPEYAAPCCSGILGVDLLRRYIVEFQGGKPTAVQLWSPQSYLPPAGYEWIEVRESHDGQLVAHCSDRVKAMLDSKYRAYPNAKKICRDPRQSLREASAGIVFDLPHGRVWYSPQELTAPEFKNTSGLSLKYDYLKGDRVLLVKSIGRGSQAQQLEKAGLKPGMVITEIDQLPANELDLWEVNRRLSGVYGDTVKLTWKTAQGFKAEPLKVIERTIIPSIKPT